MVTFQIDLVMPYLCWGAKHLSRSVASFPFRLASSTHYCLLPAGLVLQLDLSGSPTCLLGYATFNLSLPSGFYLLLFSYQCFLFKMFLTLVGGRVLTISSCSFSVLALIIAIMSGSRFNVRSFQFFLICHTSPSLTGPYILRIICYSIVI